MAAICRSLISRCTNDYALRCARTPMLAVRNLRLAEQLRFAVTMPQRVTKGYSDDTLTKVACKSGEAQSMFDTRVRLSFKLNTAKWIPDDVKTKMRLIHKNRISKSGEFTVQCEETTSQKENEVRALRIMEQLIREAEQELVNDEFAANKLHYKDHIANQFKKQGREKELEKKEQAIKDQKSRNKDRTRTKKASKYW
eukprot:TRINITY_DN648_c1_g1_i2.p1 TRINITY_DN648_c1_g1~~TRINITY_DN648_c1_g1_i2.p1  ORF type:complete len:197 (-),score=36.55 TRINITY_DN648_c1_g1_i2:184-774(-)